VSQFAFRHDVLYASMRALLAAGSRLPLGLARAAGATLGPTAIRFARRDIARARSHLELAFPDLDPDDRGRILEASARHFGAMLGEVAWMWRAGPEDVRKLVTINGVEHLEEALAVGRGAVLVTAHTGNWELLNARLGTAGIPMTIAVREVYDPRLDHIATRVRARFGAQVVPRGKNAGRQLASALRLNRVNGLLIDQDIRDIPGVFVPFFGHEAWTPSGAAVLALRAQCPTVPAFIHRRPDGGHEVEVHPPLETPPIDLSIEERVRRLTADATAAIEGQIRRFPEQWVWMHRRWRTRPEDVVASVD
jgi:KDO2-lipid IV(A) lauroyltransferase